MTDFLIPSLVLAGVLIGALLTWLLTRGRLAAQIEAAVLKAESASQAELAQLKERLRGADEIRAELQLDVATLTTKTQDDSQELRALTASLSERTESVRLTTEKAESLAAENLALESRNTELAQLLQTSNERKATLEEQVIRLEEVTSALSTAQAQAQTLQDEFSTLKVSTGKDISRLNAELTSEQDAHKLVKDALALDKAARLRAEESEAALQNEVTELRARSEAETQSASEKLTLLVEAKTALSEQFKVLANDILDEKSKKFAEQNQTSLGQMLDPLKLQLTEFKVKVEEVYVQEGKDRSALGEQVRSLLAMNQQLSDDAKGLTKALKGESKTQGNWGELVLETVLEASGLRKGFEYIVQDSQTREDGSRAQPDVVVNLPEERRLVIDAKVSLTAYADYSVAETEELRALHLRSHLDSVRTHIKGLSSKKYQELYGLQSLDFVLMFVPIEPAFMTAVTGDKSLFMDAWGHNVLLVSPSTLLFVVRTVAHLWRQEAQSRNAQEIAKRGAELYDRLSTFVADLEAVGTRLKQAQASYDSAHKRLATGNGNVIRQAQMLRDLGVKPTKSLPPAMIALASPEGSLELASAAELDASMDAALDASLDASLMPPSTDLPQ